MGKVLIQGGRIVTAVDDYVADILIDNGKIELIARDFSTLSVEDAEIYDATSHLVMPGGIDVHIHTAHPA
ncbi:MAG: hypothetical protein AAFU53_02450 [Cyanobacteria bacterium J06632_3]